MAIPPNANDVHKQQPMVQRDELEVDHLHKWPDHPIGEERLRIALLQLLLGRRALQHRHAAQKHPDEGRRKDALVARHAGEDGRVWRPQGDVP